MIQNSSSKISEILRLRKLDLEREMQNKPIKLLKEQVETLSKSSINKKNFKDALNHDDDVAVICEFKPASPSMGDISDSKLEDAIDVFKRANASAISILTEERYFKGSMNNLESTSRLSDLPVLRKDFIMDEYQIFQAKIAGADAVLIMSGIYPDIKEGVSICRELGLDPVVECKNRNDIEHALKADIDILGINNRNFNDFSIDLNTTKKLAEHVPSEVILVSESGVKNPEDAKRLSAYGSDALLIGSSIMGVNGKESMLKAASDIVKAVAGKRVART